MGFVPDLAGNIPVAAAADRSDIVEVADTAVVDSGPPVVFAGQPQFPKSPQYLQTLGPHLGVIAVPEFEFAAFAV